MTQETPSALRPPTPGALERALPTAFVLLGCAFAAASYWLCSDFIVDDALISLRYARNFLEGRGLVFNPGEYVEGFTNLGHLLIVIALGGVGVDLVTASRLIGIVGMVVAVVYGPAVVLPDASQATERAVARLLCLSNFFFVYLSFTGMETGLYVGLVCLAFYRFKRCGDRVDWLTGLLAGSLFLVRPDGALFGVALLGLAVYSHGVRPLLGMAGPWLWLAIIAATEVWRFSYYGELVPNTAFIKGAGSNEMSGVPWYGTVGDDLVEFLAHSGGVAAVMFALVALIRHPDRGRVWLAIVVAAATLTFVLYAGGDWMLGYRYFLPLLPFYLSLVAVGMKDVFWMIRDATGSSLALPGFAVGVVIVAAYCWSIGLDFKYKRDRYPHTHMTSEYMIPASKWIASHYPKDYQVTAGAIGSLGYYTDLRVIDLVGLTDVRIARIGPNRMQKNAYLEERNPELALLNAELVPPHERELYGRRYRLDRFFRRGIERPWVLYVRSDLPLAARDDGEAPRELDSFRRVSPDDPVPSPPRPGAAEES